MLPISGEFTVFAPAKINLSLSIGDRRPDGFHAIESVFLAVDFGDYLRFSIQNEPSSYSGESETIYNEFKAGPLSLSDTEYHILSDGCSLSIPDNIIPKAVSLFRKRTGFSRRIKIVTDKNIPIGGGLGGGSSDAAAVLTTLNKAAGFPCGRGELLEIGAALGSDVPFFLYNTPAALVKGRGDIIEPVDMPEMFLALVNPGFPSDTGAAFRLLDERRKSMPDSSFINDFLPVFDEPEKSVYLRIISQLQEAGADNASLSGSGSTCFGVFSDWGKARKAAESLADKWSFVKAVKTYYF